MATTILRRALKHDGLIRSTRVLCRLSAGHDIVPDNVIALPMDQAVGDSMDILHYDTKGRLAASPTTMIAKSWSSGEEAMVWVGEDHCFWMMTLRSLNSYYTTLDSIHDSYEENLRKTRLEYVVRNSWDGQFTGPFYGLNLPNYFVSSDEPDTYGPLGLLVSQSIFPSWITSRKFRR